MGEKSVSLGRECLWGGVKNRLPYPEIRKKAAEKILLEVTHSK